MTTRLQQETKYSHFYLYLVLLSLIVFMGNVEGQTRIVRSGRCSNINPDTRTYCGWDEITGPQCRGKGCCFDPSSGNGQCFLGPSWNVKETEFKTPGIHSSAKWVAGSDGFLPEYAVQSGSEDGHALYVARAYHAGALIPGKFHDGHKKCYVSWHGREHHLRSYEILVANPGDLKWSHESRGSVGSTAVVGGRSENGETLFICRFYHGGTFTPGKIHPSHHKCYIPYGGREFNSEHYDVLHA